MSLFGRRHFAALFDREFSSKIILVVFRFLEFSRSQGHKRTSKRSHKKRGGEPLVEIAVATRHFISTASAIGSAAPVVFVSDYHPPSALIRGGFFISSNGTGLSGRWRSGLQSFEAPPGTRLIIGVATMDLLNSITTGTISAAIQALSCPAYLPGEAWGRRSATAPLRATHYRSIIVLAGIASGDLGTFPRSHETLQPSQFALRRLGNFDIVDHKLVVFLLDAEVIQAIRRIVDRGQQAKAHRNTGQ